MSLKIRRGNDSERLTITPDEGELIYTTDNKRLYVGDGVTVGGKFVTGVGYTGSIGIGYTGSASTVVGYTGSRGAGYTGSAGGNGGTLVSNLNTSTYNITNGTTLTINGISGGISASGLAFGANSLVSGGPIINVAGSNNFINSSLNFSPGSPWINFYNVGATASAHPIAYTKSRGSLLSPAAVINGDQIGITSFQAYSGALGFVSAGAIVVTVDGVVTSGAVPGKLSVIVTKSSGSTINAMTVRSNQIEMSVPPVVPSYEDDIERDAAIPSPVKGMIIVVGTNFYGHDGANWNQLNN